jgi:hypothetical protein
MSTAAADETLSLVRDSVRNVLTKSEAFRALPPAHRQQLAHDMVKVARYMIDAGGETAGVPMSAVVSTGLDTPVATSLDRTSDVINLGQNRPTAGRRFQDQGGAVAAKSGGQAYTDLINKVNFPRFVAGLVDGVFNAIVTSSIKQMEAYGTLVANVAKSVDEYMRDNVSENQARDYLASKYPQHLKVDTTGKQPKLVPKQAGRGRGGRAGGRGPLSQGLAAGPQGQLPDFMKDLGLPEPVTRLDAKTAEQKLVPAARRRMAMDRQQLLATMVLMGINRLIVTDGKIAASCLFELDTTDAVYEDTETAASFDETKREYDRGWSFWFFPSSGSSSTSHFNVSTTNTSSSTAEATMHASLSGNVDINFRSETFPLEKMADVLQIRQIEEKAPQAAPAPPPGTPPTPIQLPPPPPLPTLPGAPGAAPAPAAPAPAPATPEAG